MIEFFITQAVLEMFEKQTLHLEKFGQFAGVDYIRERLGYYEKRSHELKVENNGGLSLSEIVELYDITTHYCYALEGGENTGTHHRYYVAFVNQVKDKLASLREQRELAR